MTEARSDLYAVLGVPRTASSAEIKKAYRKLARKFHPDVNPGDKSAETRFKELSHAAAILGDTEKRKLYDRYGEAAFSAGFDPGASPRPSSRGRASQRPQGDPFAGLPFDFDAFTGGGGFAVEDLFEVLGGGGGRQRRAPAPGEPVQATVSIPFADAVRGAVVTIPVRRRHRCEDCAGAGQKSGTACAGCRGSGERIGTERVKVKIPEGIDEGGRVRVAGQGHPSVGGGAAGDLFVQVRIEPHPFFQRQGDDIVTEIPITVREAYLGAEIEIPTIHGPVRAKIPPGTGGGQRFRLRGRGVRNVQTRAHGDHVYRVNVVVPLVPSDAGRAAVENLDLLYGGPVRGHLPKRLE